MENRKQKPENRKPKKNGVAVLLACCSTTNLGLLIKFNFIKINLNKSKGQNRREGFF